jgi:PHD/YefM family antitoxin component YafN of YafNO toxin-antitoxin module
MSRVISANELKTKGIKAIENSLLNEEEAIISVRGKEKFVVLPIDKYNNLREYELEAAIKETLKEIKDGNFVEESVEKHIKRISSV